MQKKLKDSEILKQVLDSVHMTKNKFGPAIGYSNSTSIYHVFRNEGDPLKQPITSGMIDKILARFPNVSYAFLTKGEGNVLNPQPLFRGEITSREPYSIREHLDRMESKIDLLDKQMKDVLSMF